MTYIIKKPFIRATAGVVIVAVGGGAYYGIKDISFKGVPTVLAAAAAPSTSVLNAPLVENPISGPAIRVIPPETNRFFVLKST